MKRKTVKQVSIQVMNMLNRIKGGHPECVISEIKPVQSPVSKVYWIEFSCGELKASVRFFQYQGWILKVSDFENHDPREFHLDEMKEAQSYVEELVLKPIGERKIHGRQNS